MLENIKKPENFYDLLKLQEVLDKQVAKERRNGFIPRKRNSTDIRLSMIAETIEFNEETERSHKTWKEKEINENKLKEEAVDVLFFFLQLINFYSDDKLSKKLFLEWEEQWKEEPPMFDDVEEEYLIKAIINYDFLYTLINLLRLYKRYNITKDEVYNTYWNKWQTNMKRINEDWSLKK